MVGEHEDGGCGEGMNKCVKGGLSVCSPYEGHVFLSELEERVCDLGIVMDKALIKVAKAKE
jgi:hypothetical protein